MKYDIKTISPVIIAKMPVRIPRNLNPYKLFSFWRMLLIKMIVPLYDNKIPPNKVNSFSFHTDIQIIKSTKPIAMRKNSREILFISEVSNKIQSTSQP